MAKKNIMAVSLPAEQAGSIVYWSLSGEVGADALRSSIAGDVQLPSVPDGPSPETACLRAVNAERSERKRRLRRPLEGRTGHALVDERAEADDLDYSVRATAKVDAAGRCVVETDDAALKTRIEDEYRRIVLAVLSPSDVGAWLVKVVAAMDGVALRPTGGFYFIPRTAVAQWQAVAAAVRGCAHHSFYAVPALHADEAVEAVLAAVTAEAKAYAEETWAMLQDEKMGARALTSRCGALEAQRSKVERYEKLLGVAMPELRTVLDALSANCTAAALLAEDDKPYAGMLNGSALDALAAL